MQVVQVEGGGSGSDVAMQVEGVMSQVEGAVMSQVASFDHRVEPPYKMRGMVQHKFFLAPLKFLKLRMGCF